jgi:hypothetical protein
MVVRRGRDGGEGGRGLRPDEEYGAGGVVNDEATDRSEASWAQVCEVTVSGDDEQLRAVGGGDDLALGPSRPLPAGAGTAQTSGGVVKQFLCRGRGELFQSRTGVAFAVSSSQEPGIGVVGRGGNVLGGDV